MDFEMNEYLSNLYYTLKDPASFSSADTLYRRVRDEGKFKMSKRDIQNWLNAQDIYTKNVNVDKKKRRYDHIITPYPNYQLFFDSAYVKLGSKRDKMIVAVDPFSKTVFAKQVPNLKASTVAKAVNKILDESKVTEVVTFDRGTEYKNSLLLNSLTDRNINYFFSSGKNKSSAAELAIKRLKKKLARYTQSSGKKSWYTKLNEAVESLNSKKMKTLNYHSPDEVLNSKALQEDLWFNKKWETLRDMPLQKTYKFAVGAPVRFQLYESTGFAKEYANKFSKDVHFITSRSSPQHVNRYQLKSKDNKPLPRSYREDELIMVNLRDSDFKIDKILDRRNTSKGPQVLVKWKDRSDIFNTWLDKKDVPRFSE